MLNRRLARNTLVTLSIFLAGVVVPVLFDRLTKGITTDQQITLLLLILFFMAQIISMIIIYSIFKDIHEEKTNVMTGTKAILDRIESERNDVLSQIREEQSDINSRIETEHGDITARLQAITLQFGLAVKFVEEDNGTTYELTREMIEQAETSLIFLDAWAQTNDYFSGEQLAKERRQAYYDAIIKQTQKHIKKGNQFHKRIIQVPTSTADLDHFTLVAGPIFQDYLKQCLQIRAASSRACVLRIALPVIHAQFIIIDQRYVVWPMLTSDPQTGRMKRHGAIFFDDPLGQFVPRIMSIYNMIDSHARPLEVHHLGEIAPDMKSV